MEHPWNTHAGDAEIITSTPPDYPRGYTSISKSAAARRDFTNFQHSLDIYGVTPVRSRSMIHYRLLEDAYVVHTKWTRGGKFAEPDVIFVSPRTFADLRSMFNLLEPRGEWERIAAPGLKLLKFNNAKIIRKRWCLDGIAMFMRGAYHLGSSRIDDARCCSKHER